MDNPGNEIKADGAQNYWEILGLYLQSDWASWMHPQILNRWQGFHTLLAAKNEVMNLTRIESDKDAILKHYLDSWLCWLEVQKVYETNQIKNLLDFGCGGGFPSFPIALGLDRSLELILVDARVKKLDFLKEASLRLGLFVKTVHAHWTPKESRDWAKKNGLADCVMARAVGPSVDLIKTLAPVTKKVLLLTRGPNLLDREWEEAKALALSLGFKKAQLVTKELSFADMRIERNLFLFVKE
ncbi:MAG: class I SAM-dependent methyltransferase [Candidatus Cloacimonetes bacterium]|nr:class I SAM-dependent methyltransferase [Candidatus Cloacimonadota bacterium]